MIDYEYKLCKCISIVNDNDDLFTIQNTVDVELGQIPDHTILEIFVLIMDEIILKKFPSIDVVPLLEKKYFSTSFGGNKYFILIQEHLKNRDASILKLLYMGLKLGFNGQYEHVPDDLVLTLENLINLSIPKTHNNFTFLSKHTQSTPFSVLWIVFPILLYLLLKNILDMYYFSNITMGSM